MTSARPDSTITECPHGLRPGTSVCLRCRHEARRVARQRRVRLAAMTGAALMGVAVVVALAVGAWNAISHERGGPDVLLNEAAGSPAAPAARTPRSAPAPVETPSSSVQPTIAEGRRDLGDSIYAVREGRQVTVYFDTDSLRTRFDWKFEGVVRATLPLVFGPAVGDALDSIPVGTLAGGRHLLDELPTRGIPIRIRDQTLRVWPVTRPGRDGPLVYAYRAAATR